MAKRSLADEIKSPSFKKEVHPKLVHRAAVLLFCIRSGKAKTENAHLEPKDLVQDMLVRVVEEKRKCPPSVTLLNFLLGVLDSVGNHAGDRDASWPAVGYEEGDRAAPSSERDEMIDAKRRLHRLEGSLAKDPEVLALYLAMTRERAMTPEDQRKRLVWDEAKRKSVLARLDRRVAAVAVEYATKRQKGEADDGTNGK